MVGKTHHFDNKAFDKRFKLQTTTISITYFRY